MIDSADVQLYLAITTDDVAVVRDYLKGGMSPDHTIAPPKIIFHHSHHPARNVDRRLLDLAVDSQSIQVVRALANAGANLDLVAGRLDPVVFRAVPDVLRVLLECGANPNVVSRIGDTPLHGISNLLRSYPAVEHYVPTCRLLLEFGADVHARDVTGETPLLMALRKASVMNTSFGAWYSDDHIEVLKVAQMLLDAGADPLAEDYQGVSLHTHCRRLAFHEGIDLLDAHIAQTQANVIHAAIGSKSEEKQRRKM
ncbi:ankyrin repeat domain-containing protein [Stenotrophomonas sp. GD03819]|uniref:ankyrin repeat domain-containing protein n=1 Tax=Stenotrophomonas sp. GD03819 TaxID=2975384 RepID=UPI0024476961|nr:ankyrin repeat domain-containing protein [Stenotrophomonas sp. GD03819]MDH1791540.1 ankyrin repeat domain-containing protein [Stenotrophomonas sp. GD03819]